MPRLPWAELLLPRTCRPIGTQAATLTFWRKEDPKCVRGRSKVTLPPVTLFSTSHTTENQFEMDLAAYDALSPAEQAAHDASQREKEAQEQAALPYRWTQALDHVALNFPVEQGTKAKALDIKIKKKSLSIAQKGGEVLLEGEFPKEVKLEDSVWSLGK